MESSSRVADSGTSVSEASPHWIQVAGVRVCANMVPHLDPHARDGRDWNHSNASMSADAHAHMTGAFTSIERRQGYAHADLVVHQHSPRSRSMHRNLGAYVAVGPTGQTAMTARLSGATERAAATLCALPAADAGGAIRQKQLERGLAMAQALMRSPCVSIIDVLSKEKHVSHPSPNARPRTAPARRAPGRGGAAAAVAAANQTTASRPQSAARGQNRWHTAMYASAGPSAPMDASDLRELSAVLAAHHAAVWRAAPLARYAAPPARPSTAPSARARRGLARVDEQRPPMHSFTPASSSPIRSPALARGSTCSSTSRSGLSASRCAASALGSHSAAGSVASGADAQLVAQLSRLSFTEHDIVLHGIGGATLSARACKPFYAQHAARATQSAPGAARPRRATAEWPALSPHEGSPLAPRALVLRSASPGF